MGYSFFAMTRNSMRALRSVIRVQFWYRKSAYGTGFRLHSHHFMG